MLYPPSIETSKLINVAVPLATVAFATAFWFSSLAGHLKKDALVKEKEKHSKEKEQILIKAERSKAKAFKEAQKSIVKETKKAHAKANFKVGMAFSGAIGVGLLFMFAQMVTAGLLTLTTAGGALGGYYLRGKRVATDKEKQKELEMIDVKAIESK